MRAFRQTPGGRGNKAGSHNLNPNLNLFITSNTFAVLSPKIQRNVRFSKILSVAQNVPSVLNGALRNNVMRVGEPFCIQINQ
jgi:hypothetical protein